MQHEQARKGQPSPRHQRTMQDGDMQGRALLGISRVDAWDRHSLYTGSFRLSSG